MINFFELNFSEGFSLFECNSELNIFKKNHSLEIKKLQMYFIKRYYQNKKNNFEKLFNISICNKNFQLSEIFHSHFSFSSIFYHVFILLRYFLN